MLKTREQIIKSISTGLNDYTDLESALKSVVTKIKKLTKCSIVGIRLLEDNGDYPYYVSTGLNKKTDPGLIDSMVKPVITSTADLGIERGSKKPRWNVSDKGSYWLTGLPGVIKSAALVVVRARKEKIGLIQIMDRHERKFDKELVQYMEMVGEQIGISVQNVKLLQQLYEKIIELHKKGKELELYATMDMMTGTLNRRSGVLFLEKQLKLVQRQKYSITVCFIDINGLKEVNDKYGHLEGDWLITSFVDILKSSVRDSDLICRLGGDEFLLVFTDCTVVSAQKIIDKIQDKINDANTKNKKPFPVSFSYGFAECCPDKIITADELLAVADKQMYIHKTQYKEQLKKNNIIQ
jgi:diguanylate cyclase (GGDEF)-like protein